MRCASSGSRMAAGSSVQYNGDRPLRVAIALRIRLATGVRGIGGCGVYDVEARESVKLEMGSANNSYRWEWRRGR
jgi:hypothetical protein